MKYVEPPRSRPFLDSARKQLSKLFAGSRKQFTRKRVAIVGGVLAVVLIAIPVTTYSKYANDISDRDRLMNRNSTGIILRDKNGKVFYEFGKLNGIDDAKLSEISDTFEKTLIASEDQNFRSHEGYSIKGIASAMYANVLNKDPTRYGGSTITQQLVKNKLLTDDKSYLRKYKELAMAIAVERQYSKDEILEMYINSVYFGEGAFGIVDAAKAYYNKSPEDLNTAESSMLVGLLPAPAIYSPISGDAKKAKEQQKWVLNRMVENGLITEKEKKAAFEQKLAYNPKGGSNKPKHGQHFAMMVLNNLKQKYGEEVITRSGYDVTTTLDLNWQKQAEANVRERVQALSHAGARNAGLVATDPRNGHIRAMVGSVNWENPKFGKVNMATAQRQPGSSFKPIFYTEAMKQRIITPATILEDTPTTFGATYQPTNYDFKYRGDISVRNALAQSLNVPSVKVMQKLGVKEATATAQRMGISTVTEPEKYGLSLALGTAEVKLQEMVNAYAAFANNGEQFQPVMITGITDKYNNDIFTHKQAAAKQVTSPEASFLISDILSDNQARAPTFADRLTLPNRPAAVKTGTTNDSKDAWTIGYTPSLVVGVWMGNNENEPMVGLSGSSSAGGIWRNSMLDFLGNSPAEKFKKPANVVSIQVCKGTEQRAVSPGGNTYKEFFIKGTEPSDQCNVPKPVKPEDDEQDDQDKKKQREQRRQEQEEQKEDEDEKEEESLETPKLPQVEGGDGSSTGVGGRGGGGAQTDDSSGEEKPTDSTSPDSTEGEEPTSSPDSGSSGSTSGTSSIETEKPANSTPA